MKGYKCENCGKTVKMPSYNPDIRHYAYRKDGTRISACFACAYRMKGNRIREAGWRVNPGQPR